jgi:outer membrane protein assembly factor BamB
MASSYSFSTAGASGHAGAVQVVYVSSVDTVYTLNATTGIELSRFTTGNVVGSPVVADGKVYLGGNAVCAFHLASGLATPSRPSRSASTSTARFGSRPS